ncbi:MAG: ATP-binding protein [Synergistaceae bacterium]|nr:ATP-binding protein [Synergistaceae bacterium]
MILRDDYIKRIKPFIGLEPVKVLTGLRRSGKSVMLKLIRDEIARDGSIPENNFIVFNFENMSTPRTAEALHDEIVERASNINGKIFMFFDEIQEVQDWEKCINSLRVEFDCDIYITGSNAKLLSGELATYLAGRYVEFIIYPFSFKEFMSMPAYKSENISSVFQKYIQAGGMPFLSNIADNQEACNLYLMDIYNSVILKDVVRRNNIRDVDQLERVINYVMADIGHSFSAASLSKYFKSEHRAVSHDTILNYIKACSDAFLFYKINREDLKGKKILTVNEKYYVADHGLRAAVYGQEKNDIEQVLENLICLELLRRGYKVTVGRNGEKEIDFIASKNGEKIYLQVCYLLAEASTIEREFGAYRGIPDNYPKYVLSLDEVNMSRDGIKHFNIRDFLLKDEWN